MRGVGVCVYGGLGWSRKGRMRGVGGVITNSDMSVELTQSTVTRDDRGLIARRSVCGPQRPCVFGVALLSLETVAVTHNIIMFWMCRVARAAAVVAAAVAAAAVGVAAAAAVGAAAVATAAVAAAVAAVAAAAVAAATVAAAVAEAAAASSHAAEHRILPGCSAML